MDRHRYPWPLLPREPLYSGVDRHCHRTRTHRRARVRREYAQQCEQLEKSETEAWQKKFLQYTLSSDATSLVSQVHLAIVAIVAIVITRPWL